MIGSHENLTFILHLTSTVGEHDFEFKPHFISTLSKFHNLESEDAYFFIREFEEACLMMKIPHLVDDAIRLRFVPFHQVKICPICS